MQGQSRPEIVQSLGVSKGTVSKILYEHALELYKDYNSSVEEIIENMDVDEATLRKKIAARFGEAKHIKLNA
jgi:hypothetical protein